MTIARHDSETCDACGSGVDLAWWADDEMWRRVYLEATGMPAAERGGEPASGLLCTACFDAHAERLGLLLLWRPVAMSLTPVAAAAHPGSPRTTPASDPS
jgi:hypothetical protein